MRIAFVTETWRPEVDGVVTRLSATVSDLAARGHEILVIAPSLGPPMAGVTQWRTYRAVVPIIDRRRAWAMPDPRIPRRLERFEPDLVHVVSPVLMGAFALHQVARRYPVAASFHTDLAAYARRYRLGWLAPVLRALMRASYRRADQALATSPTGRRRLAECGVEEVVLWPPGIDPPGAGSPRPASNEAPVQVLCVGRLAKEKGCDRLWNAVSDSAARSTIHLTFVGDGPDRKRLERRFASTPTSFVGLRRGAALTQAYRDADVLAFPSVTETVGLVLLEAMAVGLPVVAVDTEAIRATLTDYSGAILIAPAASAPTWLAAFAKARALHPRPRVARSWADATRVLLTAYASIAPTERPGPPRGPSLRLSTAFRATMQP